MEIYQNYVGENHKFDFEDSDNNNLIEGQGYYIIEDFINFEDLRKISNDLVSIISEDVIDNTQIFRRMGIPAPIRWAFNFSKVDPFYTRFKSTLFYQKSTSEIKKGSGILEIMDLH